MLKPSEITPLPELELAAIVAEAGVFADADLDLAVDLVTGGAFFNAGQMCSATSRVLVERPIANELVARLADLAMRLVVGDPFAPGVQMGPITNRAQYERIDARRARRREGRHLPLMSARHDAHAENSFVAVY